MNLTTTQRLTRFSSRFFQNLRLRTSTVYMAMIVAALVAFEIFNFSSTDFALRDMLGGQSSGGISWSTILALAFCVMDFAGIARLLGTQEESEGRGGWYLLGAWVLAAAMNAGLTWWAISVAVYNQPVEHALILDPMTFVTLVPVLVAVMVWVIRILIIGSLVSSLNQALFGREEKKAPRAPTPFGFQPNKANVPPGYKPIPNPARSQSKDF
ncbi:MAG TPA: hypothetical protein VMW28_09305 [Pelolinea sp.]|nr:hypothetical protein [Pelolinea sp.]